MSWFQPVLVLAVLIVVTQSADVTPVEKVIELLQDLETRVRGEGTAEASTYDSFACWCHQTTDGKSQAILSGRDNIESLSASIGQDTVTKESKQSDLSQRQENEEQWTAERADTDARCKRARKEYDMKNADLTKAISSLTDAITAMENSKPDQTESTGLSLASVAMRQSVQNSLAIADAMNLISVPQRRAVSSFLQSSMAVDPSDPQYQFHSQGILDVLHKLKIEFEATKTEADNEWHKTDQTCISELSALDSKLIANSAAIDTLKAEIDGLSGTIAQSRQDLVNAEANLKDDQLYMKDMTTLCETRARDWDQRSKMRTDELTAISSALSILTVRVQWRDEEVNNRTVLIERSVVEPSPPPIQTMAEVSVHKVAPVFLEVKIRGQHPLLRGAHKVVKMSLSQTRQQMASEMVLAESHRLQSGVLSSVAGHLSNDPFSKVKELIQKLIERLLRESTSEATKKGFCDTQLGVARKKRENRMADTNKLDLEIQNLELKQQELSSEIALLTSALIKLRDDLSAAEEIRKEERAANIRTVKTAKEGLDAVREAITILKVFYKRAGKATSLVQASPVDEDTSGAGFSGAYTGRQDSSKNIVGLLEVIESDFDRTVRVTEAAEKQAAAEFVEFDRASRSDISGKEMQKSLSEEELETTNNKHAQKTHDLQTAQGLLDDALQTLEDLKPTCMDTTMSYQDRVAKREEEIAALTRALCILDTNQVEAECSRSGRQSLS